jgi:hypothetical protein
MSAFRPYTEQEMDEIKQLTTKFDSSLPFKFDKWDKYDNGRKPIKILHGIDEPQKISPTQIQEIDSAITQSCQTQSSQSH